ncbi:TPA: restriction endonuclease subunit S [Haemophilus influenzae]|uniref:Putative type I restriction/modification specificity protein n=1 Tax=Haemophilus influenzae TaxID=727 RepID=Q6J5F9_HAEIF|nr:restriction endonuclease subunit S [Haemophilus influenzae]EDJ88578.1 putative type I restriction enzyme HindVIIP specificity protein [Haemophilus influenzae 22.1-21]AAT40787.1 putative type I restriction/modification specificity protein [Haemophilus influenzae]ADO80818.1 Type I restriction enzyme HindVIIP, S protein [Haemophilus influenzae R2866]EDK11734.1 putative type I restriction enzyme HindVIIP specificity protein [Haemophilus influenzae PittII]KMZ21008.1 type I restriction modificati
MSKLVKLKEIVDFKTGRLDSNCAEENGIYPFFTCSPETLRINSYAFDCEAVLLAGNNANAVFPVKYYSGKFNAYQRTYIITPKDKSKINVKWLYFQIKHVAFELGIRAVGSATKFLTKRILDDYEINLPDLDTQNYIARVLWKLENKIQLNTQINQTLEQIAQVLFKSWFVDFDPVRAKVQALSEGMSLEQAELTAMQAISGKTPEELTALSQTQPDCYAELAETTKAFPCEMVEIDGVEAPKGWEKTTLSEICEMQNGYAFKSSDWMEQGIPVIKIGSVKPMIVEVEGNGFVSEDYSKLKPDFLLTSGDILVGLTGYVGEVGRIPTGKIAMLNQRVATFLPKEIDKNHCFYNYIYCLARQSQFKEFAEINAKGSAQANISTKELLKFPIIKANDKLHILFENRVKELLERILWNSQNAETLAKTRDLLLPRLLNGE